MKFSPEVKNAIKNAISEASQVKDGRITQKDLAALFPGLGAHHRERHLGYRDIDSTTRQIRAAIAEIENDPSDPCIIAHDLAGYFIPATRAEAMKYGKKIAQAGAARIRSTQLRIDTVSHKIDNFGTAAMDFESNVMSPQEAFAAKEFATFA